MSGEDQTPLGDDAPTESEAAASATAAPDIPHAAAPAEEPAAASRGKLQAPSGGVVVRMYGQGFGDCFLLAFATETEGRSYYVLVDCGVHQSFEGGGEFMRQVAADIREATGAELDLVVVTHRHADHISGFSQARELFAGIQVHRLWLSWLENPTNRPADLIWGQVETAVENIRHFVAGQEDSALSIVSGVLDYLPALGPAAPGEPALLPQALPAARGENLGAGRGAAAPPSSDRPDRLRDVRRLVGGDEGRIEYPQPGQGPQTLPFAGERRPPAGLKAWVLGPPGDRSALRKMEGSEKGGEQYLAPGAELGVGSVLAATDIAHLLDFLVTPAETPEDLAAWFRSCPFGYGNVMIGLDEAAADPWYREYYLRGEEDRAAALRRLGPDDWLGLAAAAALKLDDYVNNTSLVLAFELPKSKKVLLFAADAQVGNWNSWPDVLSTNADGTAVTTADLLNRTVLYKVGHHGSGNATVRARKNEPWGLERMDDAELVALLPTEEEWARRIPGWEDMPYEKLMIRLAERTAGRILRADTGLAKPDDVSPEAWAAFQARVSPSAAQVQPPVYVPSQMVRKRGQKLGWPSTDPRLQEYDPAARPLYFDLVVED